MTQLPAELLLGPFTSATARTSGVARHRLRRALADHEVRRVLRDVFVHRDLEDSLELRARAASLVVSKHAVVCDRTAAWIHGVDCLRYAELDVLPPIEAYVLRGHRATERAEVAGGARDLAPVDWEEIDGLRVTTPLRTAADLGCRLPRRDALAAMDALAHEHGLTVRRLRSLQTRYFRRRGVVQLRDLVPLVDPAAESHRESWTRLEIHDHGLPPPVSQHWVCDELGRRLFRLDLAYPHARVAVEYDGWEFHSSEEDRRRDRERRAWLRARGWTVIVVRRGDFTYDAAPGWIRELRRALGLLG